MDTTDGTAGETRCAPIETRVARLLGLLGKAHTNAILFHLVYQDPRPWRFNELEAVLDISSNTLTARLKELVATGLLTRTSYDEIPPRVEYEATAKAVDLTPAFRNLYRWAQEHDLSPEGEAA